MLQKIVCGAEKSLEKFNKLHCYMLPGTSGAGVVLTGKVLEKIIFVYIYKIYITYVYIYIYSYIYNICIYIYLYIYIYIYLCMLHLIYMIYI